MKKTLSLLLCVMLLLAFSPKARADGGGQLRDGDTVYLGSFEGAPIPWKVLDSKSTNSGEPGVFLLSEYALMNQGVIYDNAAARWEGSVAQGWCADFAAASLNDLERSAVPAVSKHEDAVQLYGLNWGECELQQEQVFFLSIPEAAQYIGPNDGDAGLSAAMADGSAAYYWLRTPHGFHNDYSGLVLEGNEVHDFLVYGSWGVRPATNLSDSAVICYLPAVGTRPLGGGALEPGDRAFKPLIQVQDRTLSLQDPRLENGSLSLRYSGAVTGGSLSVLVLDAQGLVLRCDRLCETESDAGSAVLDLSGVVIPEGGRAYLFSEEEGGDYRANGASSLCPLSLSLRFDSGEGRGEMAEQSLLLGSAVALPDCGFTAPEGKVFDHWELDGQPVSEGQVLLRDGVLRAVYRSEAEAPAPAAESAPAELPASGDEAADLPSAPNAPAGAERGSQSLFLRYGLYLAAALILTGAVVYLLPSSRRDEEEAEDQ